MVLWADTFEKLMGARVCVAVTHSILVHHDAAGVEGGAFRKAGFRLGGGDGRLDCRNGAGRSDRNPSRTASRLAGILLHRGYGGGIGLGHYFFSLPVCTSNRAGSLKSLPSLFKRPALVQPYLLTMVVILGQFTVYSYITPILMNVGHLSENATVWFLFIFGIAGIIGTVISSRTVDKHRSGTLVIPMLIMTVCVGLLTVTSSHFGALVIPRYLLGCFDDGDFDGISNTAAGYGARCRRRGDIHVLRHFQYRYRRRSLYRKPSVC